eukprot:4144374-Alexandrium_andersonii.AAC.1
MPPSDHCRCPSRRGHFRVSDLDSRWPLRRGPTSDGHPDRPSGRRGLRSQGGRRRRLLDFAREAGHHPAAM